MAQENGGANYGDSGASIFVTNGTQLTHNTAITNGGAVSCEGCQALTLQLGSSVTSNVAQEKMVAHAIVRGVLSSSYSRFS